MANAAVLVPTFNDRNDRVALNILAELMPAHHVIGINSVVGPGVEIGENSAVGAMSFVPKGTKIPPNEAWGGVPAMHVYSVAPTE